MPKGQRELFPEVIYSDSPVSIGKNSTIAQYKINTIYLNNKLLMKKQKFFQF